MGCEIFWCEIGDVSDECSEDDYYGRLEHTADESWSQDACVARSRRLGEEGWIYGLDAERLRRWAVHYYICNAPVVSDDDNDDA